MSPSAPPEGRPQLVQGVALLALLSLAAFWPALGAGFVWDDDAYVTENAVLREAGGLLRIWFDPGATPQYYPVTFTWFWIEHRVWGLHPVGWHATQLGLHAAASVLLWRWLTRLAAPGAWFAAALFAVHPLQAETVAWVTEGKNTISALLGFAAALSLTRALALDPHAAKRDDASDRRRSAAQGAALYAGALLSKTVVAALPVVMGLLVYWKRGRLDRRELRLLGPLLGLGAAFGTVTALLERHQIGAVGADWSLSVLERCLLAGRIVAFYLGKFAWPGGLSFVYPRWEVAASDPAAWIALVSMIAVTVALAASRRRLGRAPLVAWVAYVAVLAPALGFVNVWPMRYSWVADHFQYHASAALAAILGAGGAGLTGWASSRGWPGRRIAVGAAATLLVSLVALSAMTTRRFHDAETLWRSTLAQNPAAWMAHNNLGILLAARGDSAEAELRFREALRLRPHHAPAWNNLGFLLLAQGRLEEAGGALERAAEEDRSDVNARKHLAEARMRQGRLADAEAALREAASLRPDDAAIQYNLGTLLVREGRAGDAVRHLREALRLRPDFPEARSNLEVAEALAREP